MKVALGILFLVIIIAVCMVFVPMLTLWVINSLSAAGGASFYIQHTGWNYMLALLLVAIIRGGTATAGSKK